MAGVYPIASMADGGIKYSDGSVKYASYNNAVGTGTGGYPVYNTSVTKPLPAQSFQSGTPSIPTTGGQSLPTDSRGRVGDNPGYGLDPNFKYSGYGIDFGAGEAARRAYEAYPGQVDSAYNDILGNIDKQRTEAEGGYPNLEASLTGVIDAQKPLVNQAYQSGTLKADRQKEETVQREADVLSQARRLFNELQQGVQQRFGGANSAGQFANEFYGREHARQVGDTRKTTGQNLQKIFDYTNELKSKFDAQMQSLEKERATAVAQAKETLYQRLRDIDNVKTTALQNKAQMKLAALQQAQQYLAQVAAQATQFQQQLIAQRQAADLNLRNAVQSYQQGAGGAQGLSSYSLSPVAQLGQTSSNQPAIAYGSYGAGNKDYLKSLGLA